MPDFNSAELSVRQATANDSTSSTDYLTQLSHDPNREVRRAVAGNPNTPKEILQKLGEEFPEEIRTNPIFDHFLIEEPNGHFVSLSLARSSTTPAATLNTLAEVPNEEILCAIAKNPVTPNVVLEKLVQNPPELYEDPESSDYVRLFENIAKNPNTSIELLIELAEHEANVCYQIALNPKTPTELLERFALWRNVQMHRVLLQNPKTPTPVLEQLAGQHTPDIQKAIQTHPHVSKTALDIIDFINGVPNTPNHILERLASDHRVEMRRLVFSQQKTGEYIF